MFDYDTAMADIDSPFFTNVANKENEESCTSMEGWDEDE